MNKPNENTVNAENERDFEIIYKNDQETEGEIL